MCWTKGRTSGSTRSAAWCGGPPYVLDGLVYQDAPSIEEHYTGTVGSTDLVFDLFEALGYRFAPRLRDLSDQVLYRACNGASYAAPDGVLHEAVCGDLIAHHRDDINRLTASFTDGLVAAPPVVATLQAMQRQDRMCRPSRSSAPWLRPCTSGPTWTIARWAGACCSG